MPCLFLGLQPPGQLSQSLVWPIPNLNPAIHNSNPSVIAYSTSTNEVDAQQQIQDKFKKISKQFHHQASSGEDDKYMFYTLLCIFYISCQLGTHFHVMFYNVFPMFVNNL